jgi:subfamily B ATP-binding cassette protein MsbA
MLWSTDFRLYLRLLRYVKPYWRIFVLSLTSIAIVGVSEPALPALMKLLLDGTFVKRDETLIHWLPAIIIAIVVVRGVADYIAAYATSWISNRLVLDLRSTMFGRLMTLSTAYYDDQMTGNLLSKFTYDVMQVTAAATNVLTVLLKDMVSIIGLLAWLFWLDWKLTLLVLIMAPPIIVVVRLINVRLRNSSRVVQRAMGDVNQVLEETVNGHKVVKLFGGQLYEGARFFEQSNRVRRFMMKQASAAAASVPIVQLLAGIALAAIVYLAVGRPTVTAMSVSSFVSFITAMLMLTSPLKRITSVNEPLQRGLAAAESVFELIDQPGEPDRGDQTIARARGEIDFSKVSFHYGDPQRLALDSVSLKVAPGETIALVGASGGGKTTLANLVPRFYHPTSGRILLDGHDLEDLTLASLRSNIALVSQDVVLFNDSVAANIAYGAMRDTAEAEIIGAAEAAHAMEFIRQMPEGLQTLIGENGVKLSGGQRQRIAIARALLRNAPILILDEATSALDSESERHVQVALETLMQGRTTIVIAHRLSTIEKADRIVVLHNGRIVEVGDHRELIARGENYARFYHTQFAERAEQQL